MYLLLKIRTIHTEGRYQWCLPLLYMIGSFLCSISSVFAQYSALETLQAAKQHGREIKKQESNIRAADAHITHATAALRPDIFLEVGAGAYTEKKAGSSHQSLIRQSGGYAHIKLTASQVIFDNGSRKHAIEAALLRRKVETSRLDMIEQQTLLNAIKAHYNVIYKQSVFSELKKQLQFLNAEARKETERFENGAATRQEYAIVDTYLANAERLFLEAKHELQKALLVYERQSGVSPVKQLVTSDVKLALPKTVTEAIKIATKEHPLLTLNHFVSVHLKTQNKFMAADIGPKLFIEGRVSKGYLPEQGHQDVASVGLRLAVPLLQKTVIQNNMLPAKEELFRHQLDADEMFDSLLSDVEIVFATVSNSRRKLSASSRAAKKARMAFEASLLGRDEYLLNTPEMLEVHAIMMDAVLQQLHAERELQISQYALLYSVGRLKLDFIDVSLGRIPVPTPRVVMFSPPNEKQKTESDSDSIDYWQGLRATFVDKSNSRRIIRQEIVNDR